MKHLFIINPAAGKGKAVKIIPVIKALFDERPDDFVIEITKGPGHAAEIAASYAAKGIDRIYSVGGDGTLNEVLNGMAGTDCSLGIIPCGSGNDFIRSIYRVEDVKKALPDIINGTDKYVDLGRVNGRYFINVASLGFDADVVHNTRLIKKLPFISGKMAYILGIFTTLIRNKSHTIAASMDGFRISGNHLLIAVANGKYYGGGMMPAPEASLDDGLLDICTVKKTSRIKILRLFPLYIKGQHGSLVEVDFYKSKKIKIIALEDIALNVDGEISMVRRAQFELIPKGVKIVIPDHHKA